MQKPPQEFVSDEARKLEQTKEWRAARAARRSSRTAQHSQGSGQQKLGHASPQPRKVPAKL
eukprot:416725-Lingulodinium_polyedra.AAC.1